MNINNVIKNIRKLLNDLNQILTLQEVLNDPNASNHHLRKWIIGYLYQLKYDKVISIRVPKNMGNLKDTSQKYLIKRIPRFMAMLVQIHLIKRSAIATFDKDRWPHYWRVSYVLTKMGQDYVNGALPANRPYLHEDKASITQVKISDLLFDVGITAPSTMKHQLTAQYIISALLLIVGIVTGLTHILIGVMVGLLSIGIFLITVNGYKLNLVLSNKKRRKINEAHRLSRQLQHIKDLNNRTYKDIKQNCNDTMLDFLKFYVNNNVMNNNNTYSQATQFRTALFEIFDYK